MSEHGLGTGDPAPNNDYGLRASAGISWMVLVFIGISLVIIFWQGWNVVSSSGSGKVWPAGDATKIQLPPSHL